MYCGKDGSGDDRPGGSCGGGLFLWITNVAAAVVVTTGTVDDDRGDGCHGEWPS